MIGIITPVDRGLLDTEEELGAYRSFCKKRSNFYRKGIGFEMTAEERAAKRKYERRRLRFLRRREGVAA